MPAASVMPGLVAMVTSSLPEGSSSLLASMRLRTIEVAPALVAPTATCAAPCRARRVGKAGCGDGGKGGAEGGMDGGEGEREMTKVSLIFATMPLLFTERAKSSPDSVAPPAPKTSSLNATVTVHAVACPKIGLLSVGTSEGVSPANVGERKSESACSVADCGTTMPPLLQGEIELELLEHWGSAVPRLRVLSLADALDANHRLGGQRQRQLLATCCRWVEVEVEAVCDRGSRGGSVDDSRGGWWERQDRRQNG